MNNPTQTTKDANHWLLNANNEGYSLDLRCLPNQPLAKLIVMKISEELI